MICLVWCVVLIVMLSMGCMSLDFVVGGMGCYEVG